MLTTSDVVEQITFGSVDAIGSARRIAGGARQSAASPEPGPRVACQARHRASRPQSLVEHVEDLVRTQVDHNGGVVVASTFGKFTHADALGEVSL